MKVIIFGNSYKKENLSLLPVLFDVLTASGSEVEIEPDFLRFIKESGWGDFPGWRRQEMGEMERYDLAISMGGDGTFLRTAARIGRSGVPIVGVNTGRLGFLTAIASQDAREPLERVMSGDYHISERTPILVECVRDGKVQKGCFGGEAMGLNEVAVMKEGTGSMVKISAYLDDVHLLDYQSDGLVVSTPTGSTAYNMSVGGPIVMPGSHNLTLSPIAPHSLTLRPLVITDDYVVRLRVQSRTGRFLASVDGRSEAMDEGTEIVIKRAPFKMKVVFLQENAFIATLKDKLLWGADSRAKS
ncbi:MAG: NAD kinase [Paludibacteraceae bacterium]|nr:NAD kinase [Paludibacteraceae bacterium]MCR4620189.1 NAD kinase [Paludibacteraceae bacterium]